MKSKYESHVAPYIDKISGWAAKGATAKDIAKKLDVAYSAFRKYVDLGRKGDKRYEALAAAFTVACEVPDDAIETALYDRAKGISWEEKTYERKKNPDTGEMELVLTKTVTKYIPPDPTSAMFWLTNRRPDRWKYKPSEDQGEDTGGGVVQIPAVMDSPGPPIERGAADG
jgi:hypothetical protein